MSGLTVAILTMGVIGLVGTWYHHRKDKQKK
jgi:hypothetical protein